MKINQSIVSREERRTGDETFYNLIEPRFVWRNSPNTAVCRLLFSYYRHKLSGTKLSDGGVRHKTRNLTVVIT